MNHYSIYNNDGSLASFGCSENVDQSLEISEEEYNELKRNSLEIRKYTDMLANGEIEAANIPEEYRETAARHAENILALKSQHMDEITDSEALAIILGGDGA